MSNSNDNSQAEALLKLGAVGAGIYGAIVIGKKLFGVRSNPSKAVRKSRNNDSIKHFVVVDELPEDIRGLFHDGAIDDAFYENGEMVFVDVWGDEHYAVRDNPESMKVVLEKHHDEESPWWQVVAIDPSDLKSNSDYYSDGNYSRKRVTEKNQDHIDFILEQQGVNPIYARIRGRGWQYSTL